LNSNKIEIKRVVINHSSIRIFQFFSRLKEILLQLYFLKDKNVYFCVYNFNIISLINLILIKYFSFLYNRNIILYVQIHRVDFESIKLKKITHAILKNYNVIVLNSFQKEYLCKFGISSTIIRNSLINEIFLDYKVKNKYHNFTFVSNYIETKGIILLLQTFNKFKNKSVRLSTYGNYLDPNITKKELKKYESDHINIYDNLDESNKSNVFSQTSCLILPSLKTEAQSILVLEAMYHGIPIIVSNVGTIKDMVGDNYDLLVNDISENNLFNVINNFISYDIKKIEEISFYLKNRYQIYFSRKLYLNNISTLFSFKNNIVFISSSSIKTTGQSIISENVLNILSESNNIMFINTNKYNNKFINIFSSIYYTLKFYFFYSYNSIYITISRSEYGFLKDYFIIKILSNKVSIIINHIHGINFINNYQTIFKRFLLKSFFNKTKNIVLHRSFLNEYINYPNFKYSIIENFVDPNFKLLNFTNSRDEITIFYPSNILYSKGIDIFLDVAERLLNYDNSYKFIIAGDFFEDKYKNRSKIKEKFTIKYNLIKEQFPNNIIFVGKINFNQKLNLYSKSTFVLSPTFYEIEAFPLIGLESFASKCFFLTNNHNYLKSVFSKYNVFYTNNNPVEYFNLIIKISNNIDKYNSILDYNYNLVFRENNYLTFKNKISNLFLN
jgi:glycosyltransferase involved in cell wall biosynthesis